MSDRSAAPIDLRISHEELLFLMGLLGATNLAGMERKILQDELLSFPNKAGKEKAGRSLAEKGVLEQSTGGEYKINSRLLAAFDALFFPERALVATLSRAEEGLQIISAMQKGDLLVLHFVPGPAEHAIRLIPRPEILYRLLTSWFFISRLPASRSKFILGMEAFEKIRAHSALGQQEAALRLLETAALDPGEKAEFLQALANRTVHGTLAWMSFQDQKISKADSIAVFSDSRTGWLISQADSNGSGEPAFAIRRTGADFALSIQDYVERLTGKQLPRKQMDPSGRFTRFMLTGDECAAALEAINCPDLGVKMYAALSGDSKLEKYPQRIKIARQALSDSGLCKISAAGIPDVETDLAQALFSIARADSMIQITASGHGSAVNTCIYLVRGRFFASFFNHGEFMQVIEYGDFKNIGFYLESLFKDFCPAKLEKQKAFSISFDSLDKAGKLEGKSKEIEALFVGDKIPPGAACSLAEGLSESIFRATLLRRDPPEKEPGVEGKKREKPPVMLLLLVKSRSGSWIFEFQETGIPGIASPADREVFRKALTRLIL